MPNKRNVISISQIGTIVAQIRYDEWYSSQNIFTLSAKNYNEKLISLMVLSSINKSLKSNYENGYSKYPTLSKLKNDIIQLPICQDGSINFSFMEKFIAELEATHLAELDAYLSVSGFKDYELTSEEEQVLKDFEHNKIEWLEFNLCNLFGKATRGKRLKSLDRLKGKLPFVTAGESEEGISDYISNDVEIFSPNTVTIDMFGSAKYRNYKYGADDHIAVVHTESLEKNSSIFLTAAIHKSSHNGQFSYSRNFYAKDADELNIMLPVINGKPNYDIMTTFISAVQKLVIKDVVIYANEKLQMTKQVIEKNKL